MSARSLRCAGRTLTAALARDYDVLATDQVRQPGSEPADVPAPIGYAASGTVRIACS
jgi:hypothetical protein